MAWRARHPGGLTLHSARPHQLAGLLRHLIRHEDDMLHQLVNDVAELRRLHDSGLQATSQQLTAQNTALEALKKESSRLIQAFEQLRAGTGLQTTAFGQRSRCTSWASCRSASDPGDTHSEVRKHNPLDTQISISMPEYRYSGMSAASGLCAWPCSCEVHRVCFLLHTAHSKHQYIQPPLQWSRCT